MNALHVLEKLHGLARLRKCCLLLEKAERDFVVQEFSKKALFFPMEIANFLLTAEESSQTIRASADAFLASVGNSSQALRALNDFRHSLKTESGQSSADWDLVDPSFYGAANAAGGLASPNARIPRFPDLGLYLEDIRSPFNVGTMFRTAEALGFGEILLSPDCASPLHPRAMRSSMGIVERMPWRHCALDDLPSKGEILALELGGTPLSEYDFPEKGILIVGSEELGISTQALERAGSNRISIPMFGIKASLNVAVAFGIAGNAWVTQILANNP
jgi:TrmH family RNA methyltransferase